MEQPRISLPPATEADYFTARAACIEAMTPDGRWRAESEYNTNPKPFSWKSKFNPWKTERQLADEAKNGLRKG